MRSLNTEMKSLAVDAFDSSALTVHAFINLTIAIQ
jgi:hypothetical protein